MKINEKKIISDDQRPGGKKQWFCSQCGAWHDWGQEHPKKLVRKDKS